MAWELSHLEACAGRELLHSDLGAPDLQLWQHWKASQLACQLPIALLWYHLQELQLEAWASPGGMCWRRAPSQQTGRPRSAALAALTCTPAGCTWPAGTPSPLPRWESAQQQHA